MERNFILICYPLNKEKRNRVEQCYSIKIINIDHESSLTFKFSEQDKTCAGGFPSICISDKASKIIGFTNAIFSEFLDEGFVMAKSNCINIQFIFTFLQDVALLGKIPERFILTVFDPASRQCAQVLVDYLGV